MIFQLICEDDGGYEDRLLDYLPPPSGMTTFENDALVYSAGDDGTFGFSSNLATRQGIGFSWKEGYWLLSPSGFLLSENDEIVVQGYDNLTNRSSFIAEKSLEGAERERGIMIDANDKLGVRVEHRYTFPSRDEPVAVISISIENRSDRTMNDLAAGFYFDWDVGYAGQNNFTRLAPEALPDTFKELGVAQLFDRNNVDAAVVCAAVTNETSFAAQSAGMMLFDIVDDFDGLTEADVILLLNSGTSIQTSQVGDACGVIGMRFPGSLPAGERRDFMVVIGVGDNAFAASELVKKTILEPNSVEETTNGPLGSVPEPCIEQVDDPALTEHNNGDDDE